MRAFSKSSILAVLVGLAVVAAVGVGVIVVIRMDPTGRSGSGLGERFAYDLEGVRKIKPELISHARAARIVTGLKSARGIAAGPDGRIYVAGDKAVRIFDATGKELSEIHLSRPPRCLAVAGDGTIYVAVGDRVDVWDTAERTWAHWSPLGGKSQITCIAVGAADVFAADYGLRVVHRYDTSGKLLGRVVPKDAEGAAGTFTIPSPYFDVAITPDGLLAVANTGERRVETYTFTGEFRVGWGHSSTEVAGFVGCCNPAQMAILPDGRVVTSEKGIPTIKIYSPAGRLESVVATAKMLAGLPEQCGNPYHSIGLDVAVDPSGRVLVLDPGGNVGIFTRKETK